MYVTIILSRVVNNNNNASLHYSKVDGNLGRFPVVFFATLVLHSVSFLLMATNHVSLGQLYTHVPLVTLL